MFRGLTKTGANYLAARLANALPVEFVKVKIGNGSISSETNPYNSQNLISYMQDAKILSKRQEENAISITVQVTNENRKQGFYLKEIGVFVNDNGIEKLYWYCNEDNAQYVPAKTDSGIAFEIEIKMEVTNQESTILNWNGEGTWINKTHLENTLLNYTEKGTFTGTAKDLEDRITGLAGKQNGKFPLSSAIKGNVYLLKQTQKFYVCTQNYNGTTISVPNSYFMELSVYENMNRLENLNTSKEDKTKISFVTINSGNVDNLRTSGYYISENWDNNILGLPSELGVGNKAFYLQVFSRKTDDYTTQILYSFRGLIFTRFISGSNNVFSNWRRI